MSDEEVYQASLSKTKNSMKNKNSVSNYQILSEHCDRSISVGEVLSQKVIKKLADGWELYGEPTFVYNNLERSYDIFQAIIKR